MSSNTEKFFKAKFGDREFYFRLSLYNYPEGDVIVLKKNALRHLEIIDNVFNPFHTGTIILTNDFNILERSITPYTFLGNGRDMLDIEIIPVVTGDFDKDMSNKDIRKVLGLCFTFVVIEATELIYNNSLCKKIKLVEYGQYFLNERYGNVLALAGAPKGDTNASNSQDTGTIIKRILTQVFGSGDIFGKTFDANSNNTLNLRVYDSTPWNQILTYVVNAHTDENGSPCILQFSRGEKKFELFSLAKIFSNHDKAENKVETLLFPGSETITKLNITFKHCPAIFSESKINEFYTESPTASFAIDLLANEHIASYSRRDNTFIYDTRSSSKEKLIETFNKLFCTPFSELFSGYNLKPNFYSNNEVTNTNYSSTGRCHNEHRQTAINQKLKSLLFLGYVYKFKLLGNSNRMSNKFCDVIRADLNNNIDGEPSKWDMNTLGRHYVTTVRHIFTQDTYINEVETIKPYRLSKKKGNTIESLLSR